MRQLTTDEAQGFDAAAAGMPRDDSKGPQWLAGWHLFHEIEAASESARFI